MRIEEAPAMGLSRILIVDNDPERARTIAQGVTHAGFEVVAIAEPGSAVHQLIEMHGPDLLVIDCSAIKEASGLGHPRTIPECSGMVSTVISPKGKCPGESSGSAGTAKRAADALAPSVLPKVFFPTRETFEALLNACTDSAFLLDNQGMFLAVNRTTAGRLGMDAEELIGKSAFAVLPPDLAQRRRTQFERVLAEKQGIRYEDVWDGSNYDISCFPVCGPDGDVTRVAFFVRDVTEHKQAVRSLRETREKLEFLVALRTEELMRANQALLLEIAERKLAETHLAEELRKFRALYDLAVAMTANRTLDENLSLVVEKSRELLGTGTSFIALRHEEHDYVSMHTLSGIRTDAFKALRIPLGTGLGGKVAETGRGHIVEDYFEEIGPLLHDAVRAEGLISGIAVPIHMGQTNLGVLYAFNRNRTSFSPSALDTLALMGNLAAVEITRKRDERELHGARKDLEDRVKERTRALLRANRFLTDEITERKKTEEALALSEQMLNKIVTASPLGIAYLESGRVKWTNSTMSAMFGTSEPLGHMDRHPREFYASAEDYEWVRSTFREVLQEGMAAEAEVEFRRDDGSTFYGHLKTSALDPTDPKKGLISTISDITARKTAEQASRESDERYRTLVEESFDGILVRKGFTIVFANTRLSQMLGYDPGELEGLDCGRICHPGDSETARWLGDPHATNAAVSPQQEVRLLRKDGSSFEAEIRSRVIHSGHEPGIHVWVRDISERKQAADALRESEEKYRTIIENIEAVYYEVDRKGRWQFLNEAAQAIFDIPVDELVGKSYREFVNERDELRMYELFHEVFTTGKAIKAYHFTFTTREEVEKHLELSVAPVRDRTGDISGFRGICRDITERKQAEQELLKLEKIESIGVLAGGIAHDFNNILTAIQGNISLAQMLVDPDAKAAGRLAEAEKACLRARDLTQQLLTFSKGGAPIKKTASVRDIVVDACTFALRGSNVRCGMELPENLRSVEIDEVQIGQVLGNLIINADQAMPNGGSVHVRAENTTVAADSELPVPPGPYVRLSLADEGVGIPADILPKIFDPYFTTKSEGSGLGLATAYSIIKSHGGFITVESESGVGTTFHVSLPASEKGVKPRYGAEDRIVPGAGRVLVMDDEEQILDLSSELLHMLGYEVNTAKDGSEAIELYCSALKEGRCYDAVILDVTVPGGLGGKEVLRRLRAIDPDCKAIVSSGYSNDPIMADHARYQFDGVIPKPYSAQLLSEVLSRVIAERRGRG